MHLLHVHNILLHYRPSLDITVAFFLCASVTCLIAWLPEFYDDAIGNLYRAIESLHNNRLTDGLSVEGTQTQNYASSVPSWFWYVQNCAIAAVPMPNPSFIMSCTLAKAGTPEQEHCKTATTKHCIVHCLTWLTSPDIRSGHVFCYIIVDQHLLYIFLVCAKL